MLHCAIRRLLADKGGRVHTVRPYTSVKTAVDHMNEYGIGAVLVTADRRLLGIFTERDVLTRVVGDWFDPDTTPVSEVMTERVVTVTPDTTVEEAMLLVTEFRCRHLPVVEEDAVLGLISAGDLTRWLVRDQQAEIEQLVGDIRAG